MKAFIAVVLSLVVCIRADAPPPLPYAAAAAAAAGSTSYPSGYPTHDDVEHSASGYSHQYAAAPEGFNIQSGYEGYLVPSTADSQNTVVLPFQGLEYLTQLAHPGAGLSRLLKLASGKAILRFIPKIVLTVVAVVAVLLLGCAVTTAVCTFTPFCSISFLGWGVSRETMRSLITEDRISATAAFVTEAIKKYQELYGADSRKQQGDKVKN